MENFAPHLLKAMEDESITQVHIHKTQRICMVASGQQHRARSLANR
jgi:hypothetical protein